jgi:hypothetical protein
MGLAFWRTGEVKTLVQKIISKPASTAHKPVSSSLPGDLDLRALGQSL